ncbi:MAG: ABC transporter substrate-binding protein [Candidatus Methanomethylophilaceae archaeon]|nr:ABC transporter substrate-binding protein [Candidatus Methanomethylophilaceae archaeon]
MDMKIPLVLGIAVVAVACAGFLIMNDSGDDSGDFAGREIVPVENFDDGIVAVGQDSFRWVTYFGLADKCVMVDQNDMTNYLGKSFMYVGRAQVDIEGGDSAKLSSGDAARKYFTHTNCGITTDDVRTILELKPSIMVVPEAFYNDYRNEMEQIEAGGINTVAIGYIYTFLERDGLGITDDLERQIDVLATAFGMEERGEQLKSAFSTLVEDCLSLTSGITDKRSAYIGSLAYNGAHGIDSSIPYYIPFELAGLENILSGKVDYSGSGVKTYKASDIGSNIEDDTILFVDASGYSQNNTNDAKGILRMFQGKDAYLVAPYIWTGINYDTIFVIAYQMMNQAYGDDVLSDSELEDRIDNVYNLFYGTPYSNRNISAINNYIAPLPGENTSIFDDMNSLYLVAKGNPISGTVSIDSDGNLSYT